MQRRSLLFVVISALVVAKKDTVRFPLFDYEWLLFDTLQQYKHVWIKKATGLAITEFMLRYIAWLCVRDDSLRGAQMCIVTGPRIELAIGHIKRMKGMFSEKLGLLFDTKETVIELNGIHFEAYPSHHLDSIPVATEAYSYTECLAKHSVIQIIMSGYLGLVYLQQSLEQLVLLC